MKSLLDHMTDPYLALVSYRAIPLPWYNYSPAELLMGRRISTDIPQTASHMTPQWYFLPDFRQKDKELKEKQKRNYDCRYHVRPADTLPNNSSVWVTASNSQIPGRVVSNAGTPRSYLVDTPSGPVRRNRQHLNRRLNRTDDNTFDISDSTTTTLITRDKPQKDRIMTRMQTGTDIRPPNRLVYY